MHKFKIFAISAVVLFALALLLSQRPLQVDSDTRFLMNTMVTIKAYGDAQLTRNALEKGFAVFSQVEKFASFHLPDSETSRLNRDGVLDPSDEMKPLLDEVGRTFAETDGYFDPTFAILQKAYGFYHPEKTGRQPDQAEIEKCLEKTGFDKVVSFDAGGKSVRLASGSLLDFGGIAGGYAVKLAADAIRTTGCKCFLIDDAGDIWFEGKKADGSPWRIAVRDPRQGQGSSLAVIESFSPAAISTSGNYERFVTVDGKRLGHIMDPFTGRPAEHFQSVTVIASSPIDADVYSTAIFAMPPQKGLDWAEKRKIPVLILTAANQILLNSPGEKWFKMLKK